MNKVKSFVSDVLTNGSSSTTGLRQIANRGSSRFRASLKCCNVRCVVTILLGIAALLPAIFLLPPLPTSPKLLQLGHPIVATFQLPISATIIKEHTHQLEKNLEIAFGFAGTKVTAVVKSVKSVTVNTSIVLFAIHVAPTTPTDSILSDALNYIRTNFASLVVKKSLLQLSDRPLFGLPSSVEVLHFPGGITIFPLSIPYPLFKDQLQFKFTLSYSILHIRENFELMTKQLRFELQLTTDETFYIGLTNLRGSTILPPTTVEISVVWRIGAPPKMRFKQLSETIQHSPRNLGLSFEVFGNVEGANITL